MSSFTFDAKAALERARRARARPNPPNPPNWNAPSDKGLGRIGRIGPDLSARQLTAVVMPGRPESGAPLEPVEPSRQGASIDGRPLTWTGRVVSLDDWRRLSDWERHGISGKLWNARSRQWEGPDGE